MRTISDFVSFVAPCARLLTRTMLALALAIATLSGLPATAQRADGLDQPLLMLNDCGAGDPGEVHFTIAATGDTFPHENIQLVGETQGYDVLFDYVRPFLHAADMAYTNFDGAMLEGSPLSGYPMFNFNPRLGRALRDAGITVVSTANNHILDRGPEGLDATLRVLDESGILHHGAVPGAAAAEPRPPYLPLMLDRNGASVRVGFLAATWGTNGIPDPYGQVNLLWQSDSYGAQGGVRQSVLDAIAQARRETDIVIVAAHWGQEYQFFPSEYQVEGARAMIAAGADIILGAQPHTLQPVDLVEAGGRRGLVAYSLANFLASQGAYQDQLFTATSVILYVGIARAADGSARLTGYRYLPTIHVDSDTRPAPIPFQGYEPVIGHVRAMMRDPGGARQVAPDPPASIVDVCPPLSFAERPDLRLGGDFAEQYRTLGGTMPRSALDALVVYGYPRGAPRRELAGDCATETYVLHTDLQRLEWHPQASWPFRVVGTQLGTLAYERRYGAALRRATLSADVFANGVFQAFFEQYGGVPVFGYPISGALTEPDPDTGIERTVQYFERVRLETDATAPGGVRIGRLMAEYGDIVALCAPEDGATPSLNPAPVAIAPVPGTPTDAAPLPVRTTVRETEALRATPERLPGEGSDAREATDALRTMWGTDLRAWSWLLLASTVPLTIAAWYEWRRGRRRDRRRR